MWTGGHGRGSEDRAVSPVIGVVLMVAITVILAAVIGVFVLDLGGTLDRNAQASVTIECNDEADEISVTLDSNQNADEIEIDYGGASSGTLTTVGETDTFSASPGEYEVVVTATDGDQTQVIRKETCELS